MHLMTLYAASSKASGNEIVIVSIKPALINHLDVVTPLSDIYVYIVG